LLGVEPIGAVDGAKDDADRAHLRPIVRRLERATSDELRRARLALAAVLGPVKRRA
jgi:hypothetical protein